MGAVKDQAAEVHIEADGHYTFLLAPDIATFVVRDTGGVLPRCPSILVTVRSGPKTQVEIMCDTGIR
jgi:hypothetical protein